MRIIVYYAFCNSVAYLTPHPSLPHLLSSLPRATDGSRAAGADAISAVIGAEYKQSAGTFTIDLDAIGYGVDATALVGYEGEEGEGMMHVGRRVRYGHAHNLLPHPALNIYLCFCRLPAGRVC